MPGPAPKDASTRRRRNKTSTAATLTANPDIVAPDLPEVDWHPQTLDWWADIWSSPMAPEYDDSDIHGLYLLALLVNDFWTATTGKERTALAAEIRLQSQRFGLSPIDRRRLQWEIERTEEAQDKGERRRNRDTPPATPAAPSADPRGVLRAV